MTDQDWEVDGAKGGPAGAAGGPDTTRSSRAEPRPANVVPFPGNWFGSVEDLVPVHLEPRSSVLEAAAPPADLSDEAADASDFWEGDAAALEEISPPADSASAIALLRSPEAPKRKPPSHVTAEPDSAESTAGHAVRSRRAAVRVCAVALVLLAIGLALVGVYVIPGQGDAGRAHRVHHGTAPLRPANRQAVTQTVTSTVTGPTKARPKTHRRHAPLAAARKSPSVSSSASRNEDSSVSSVTSGAQTSNEPAASNQPSTSSDGGGSGCATQSPDSGCLP